MTSITEKIDRYKLDSVFNGGSVLHKTRLLPGPRIVPLETSWTRDKRIGSGAFGVVWREKEDRTGDLRAVKVISKLQLNVREVEALVAVQAHPRLFISFLGWFEDPHAIHIAMEYIAHGDLAQYIKDHGPKAATEVKEITTQILKALVVLHKQEICHRDLKPQNILIASPSPIWVKISDFGISKQALGTSLRSGCGTLCYQAPEQLGLLPRTMRVGSSYTKVVDMWALGVVVHEIMTSEIPFLDTFQDPESITITPELYIAGTSSFPPMLDSELLLDYCRGSEFPSECLQRNGVNEEGISFVKSMMVADPRRRPTATTALNSPWLRNIESRTPPRRQLELMPINLSQECAGQLLVKGDPAVIIEILDSPTPSRIRAMQFTAISLGALQDLTNLLKVTEDINSIPGPDYISLLQFAAGQGKPGVIEFLLGSGANVDESSHGKGSQTALHDAARGGHLEVINLLLSHGADIDGSARSENSQTALHAAVVGGHLEAMKLLLTRRASANKASHSEEGQMPLHAAAARGHLEAINLLLAYGGNINGSANTDHGQTVLHAAAWGGHLEAMKLLLHRGAGVNVAASSVHAQTPLHAAAWGGHLKAMELLLHHGANVNVAASSVHAQTPLHAAAWGGHFKAMELLLHHGANVDATAISENAQTPLHAAAWGGNVEAMELLLRRGAYVDALGTSERSQTPLHAAAWGGHLKAMEFLLHHGAYVDALGTSKHSQTALHAAASGGHLKAIDLLLYHRANVNLAGISPYSQRALYAAASGGHVKAMEMLLHHGAYVNASGISPHSQRALHAAASGGHLEAMELLLHHGASVSATASSAHPQTPLHAAAWSGHLDAIKLLLQRGANVDESHRKSPSTTALYTAASRGHLDVVKFLLDRGAVVSTIILSVAKNYETRELLESPR